MHLHLNRLLGNDSSVERRVIGLLGQRAAGGSTAAPTTDGTRRDRSVMCGPVGDPTRLAAARAADSYGLSGRRAMNWSSRAR